jgi:sugar-specific transcriptional regulator TrmB
MSTDELIERFKHLGLNTYEAKVYLALLKTHPATGYEIAKNANVPQARAYDTLKALESQNMVVSTGGKPMTYMPIPPEKILTRFEHQYQGSINFLRSSLPNYAVESIEPVHNLRGETAIFQHAMQMINRAQESVFLEMWRSDQHLLEQPLRQAVERGVKVYVVGYDGVDYDFCKVYPHAQAETIESSLGGRWQIMAVDATEGMVGTHPVGSSEAHALWTHNPALVLIIKELVVHDMFLLDVEKRLADPMKRVYGDHMLKLRNAILGDEILIGGH